jgi:hypothetical protein
LNLRARAIEMNRSVKRPSRNGPERLGEDCLPVRDLVAGREDCLDEEASQLDLLAPTQ